MCSRKKVIFIINNIFYSLIKISKSFKNENLINKNDPKKNKNNNSTTKNDFINNNDSLYFPKSKNESIINNLEIFNSPPSKIKNLKTLNFKTKLTMDFFKIEEFEKHLKKNKNKTKNFKYLHTRTFKEKHILTINDKLSSIINNNSANTNISKFNINSNLLNLNTNQNSIVTDNKKISNSFVASSKSELNENNNNLDKKKENNINKTHLNYNLNVNYINNNNNNNNNIDNKFKSSQQLISNVIKHFSELNYDNNNNNKNNENYPLFLRKFDLNPYSNFNIAKKYFLYQIKLSILQAKKFELSREFENSNNKKHKNKNSNFLTLNNNNNDLNQTNYFDIFTNYSNIKNTPLKSYEKYDDNNIKINQYLIYKSKLLGKGGFSSVYLALNMEKNKEIAVKITEKNARANKTKKVYDYVKEEVKILKRLHSKYIVEVYEIIESKNDIFIFMEYMNNNSLLNSIKSLSGFQIWRYFRNLICGVEHCHEIGKIIHKDINVNNLLISSDDTLKLNDFGISVIIENNNDLLSMHSGPSTYTPPEKIYNDFNKVEGFYHGKPADIWLIGVTLYHMVFKKPLFSNDGNISKNDYVNINLPNAGDYDERVIELIESLLNFNPEKRPKLCDLSKNSWVTHNGEFPLPDIHEEALNYCYELASKRIENIKNELNNENDEKSSSSD
jgi:tRNA A-37 threonylcarbamoyl transferase component Bud32